MTFGEPVDKFLEGLIYPIWEFFFGGAFDAIDQSGASLGEKGTMTLGAACFSSFVVIVVVVAIMSFGFLFYMRYKKDKDGMLGYADSTDGQD